jgi:hypothetical protein
VQDRCTWEAALSSFSSLSVIGNDSITVRTVAAPRLMTLLPAVSKNNLNRFFVTVFVGLYIHQQL